MRKKIFIIVGIISVLLGTVGIFIPILPTTPFLLLASFCFSRSSEKLNQKLLHNKFIGSYIYDYVENRTMLVSNKIITLSLLYVGILTTIFFTDNNLYLDIVLLIIAIVITIHILLIGRKKKINRIK